MSKKEIIGTRDFLMMKSNIAGHIVGAYIKDRGFYNTFNTEGEFKDKKIEDAITNSASILTLQLIEDADAEADLP